jgi:uncharacterized membrane protein
VAPVIQQNSATAEQSAATSEELSGQAAMHKEFIIQFKLREDNARYMTPQFPSMSSPVARRGHSWLFYYKALQMGEASKVVPIDKFSIIISMVLAFVILKEVITAKTLTGGALIAVGTFVMIL